MALRSLRCSILILTLALTACATERDLTQDNRVPTNYKADILAFLRTYLNDPTNVRDASASQPTLQHVGAGDRYVVCVRFNARKSDGKYGGVLDTAAIFNGGKLYSFIDLTPDETASDAELRTQQRNLCKTATFQPFPELEHLTR